MAEVAAYGAHLFKHLEKPASGGDHRRVLIKIHRFAQKFI